VKEAQAQNDSIKKVKTQAEDKYLALDPYGVAELSMAAKVRYGDIQYDFGQKVSNAPIPTPVANNSNPDVLAAYQLQLDKNLEKFANEAKGQWQEVLDAAKQGGISNSWSRRAQEELGRDYPNEYTSLRQEIVQGTDAP
jgi:hypothetical protein